MAEADVETLVTFKATACLENIVNVILVSREVRVLHEYLAADRARMFRETLTARLHRCAHIPQLPVIN